MVDKPICVDRLTVTYGRKDVEVKEKSFRFPFRLVNNKVGAIYFVTILLRKTKFS